MAHVLVQSRSRQYVVNPASGEILEMTGRGRPPSDETITRIIESARIARASGRAECVLPDARDIPASFTPTPRVLYGRPAPLPAVETTHDETDTEVMARLMTRYDMFRDIMDGIAHGEFNAAVVSGTPGCGKSNLVEEVIAAAKAKDPDFVSTVIKGGSVTPPMLFETLYKYRHRGNVIVMDDSDTIMSDEEGMMLLKSALDSNPVRVLTRLHKGQSEAPPQFDFQGSIAFLTNQNFSHIVENGNPMHKRIQHLGAIMDRVNYLDLMLHTARDRMIWTEGQVRKFRILERRGLTAAEQTDVINFMRDHQDDMRAVSIRAAVKLVPFVRMARRKPDKDWRDAARIMEFR